MEKLLEVKNLTTRFYTQDGVVKAVNGISYTLEEGETLGIVGESGCGKSQSMFSIMRLIKSPPGKIEAGEVLFKGKDLLKLSEKEMQKVRGNEIAMIYQDPMQSLNPVLTIGRQMCESLRVHLGMTKEEAHKRAVELLELVSIPNAAERMKDYPHQFSGGMRQRVMIAMALSCNPSLLIADEPTTALDVTVQIQIMELVKRIQEQLGITVVWISHDLGVIAHMAKRVFVMYAGHIVEDAPIKTLFQSPRHPYTIGLLKSLPRMGESAGEKLTSIPGQPPNLLDPPKGCPFAPRCDHKTERCLHENPVLEAVGERHLVACWEKDKTERG